MVQQVLIPLGNCSNLAIHNFYVVYVIFIPDEFLRRMALNVFTRHCIYYNIYKVMNYVGELRRTP